MTVRPLQSAWRFSRNELSGKPRGRFRDRSGRIGRTVRGGEPVSRVYIPPGYRVLFKANFNPA